MAETANETSATVTIQQQQQNGSAETGRSPTEAQVGGESAQQEASPPVLTLRLRPRPSVTWGADVINNEGMGKKSSKRECGKEGGAAGNIFLSEAQKQQEEEGRNVSFFTESGVVVRLVLLMQMLPDRFLCAMPSAVPFWRTPSIYAPVPNRQWRLQGSIQQPVPSFVHAPGLSLSPRPKHKNMHARVDVITPPRHLPPSPPPHYGTLSAPGDRRGSRLGAPPRTGAHKPKTVGEKARRKTNTHAQKSGAFENCKIRSRRVVHVCVLCIFVGVFVAPRLCPGCLILMYVYVIVSDLLRI